MKASSVLMNWIAFCALQHVESWTRMLAARCNLMYLVCVYVFVSVCLWNLRHHQCWEIHFTWVEGDLCRNFNYKANCDLWCKLWKQHKTSWRRLHKTCLMGRKDHMFKHDWSQFFLLLPEIVTEQIHSADLDMIFGHRDLRSYFYYTVRSRWTWWGSLSGSSSLLPLMKKAKNLILFEWHSQEYDHNVLLCLSWGFIQLWELINSVGSNGSLSLQFICDEIDETHGGTPLWVTLIRLWLHSLSCLPSNCCRDFSGIA